MPRGGSRVGSGRKPSVKHEHASFGDKSRRLEVEEAFRGVSSLEGGRQPIPGEFGRAALWAKYDALFQKRSEVSSAVLTIAGHVVSRGYTTVPGMADDAKALKAKMLCDAYALDNDFDTIIDAGSVMLTLHGTLFVENNYTGKKLIATRVFPIQSEVEPAKLDKDGTVLAYRQVRMNVVKQTWKLGEILPLCLPPVDAYGYGTSLIASTVDILNTRSQFDADVKEYIHKSTFPKELWVAGDAADRVDKETSEDGYAKVKNWSAGDAFFVNYPLKYTACGLGNVESRIFPDLIKVLNDRCIDGMLVPPVSYLRNATEASADAMMANLRIAIVQPIQRLWKRAIERGIFRQLLIGEGYDEKTVSQYVPRIAFTPPTEKELLLRAQRVATIKGAAIAGAGWAQDQLDIYDPTVRDQPVKGQTPQPTPKDPDAQQEQPPEKTPIPNASEPKPE